MLKHLSPPPPSLGTPHHTLLLICHWTLSLVGALSHSSATAPLYPACLFFLLFKPLGATSYKKLLMSYPGSRSLRQPVTSTKIEHVGKFTLAILRIPFFSFGRSQDNLTCSCLEKKTNPFLTGDIRTVRRLDQLILFRAMKFSAAPISSQILPTAMLFSRSYLQ